MSLLDTYFANLQTELGADRFVLVRDDALTDSTRSEDSSTPSIQQCHPPQHHHHHHHLKKHTSKGNDKFEEESESSAPVAPRRRESQDDLNHHRSRVLSHNRRKYDSAHDDCHNNNNRDGGSRFRLLFGKDAFSSSKLEALPNFGSPKFPVRKGSRDDLSVPSMRGQHEYNLRVETDCSNKQFDLTEFLDEVKSAIEA